MSELIKVSSCKTERLRSVIFIHGLGGHPYNTWRRGSGDVNSDDTFWPLWLAKDVPGLDIYTIAYPASPSGWVGQSMPLEDRAKNIAALLIAENGLVEKPITFICHSLGGLIVKFLMLDLQERRALNPKFRKLFLTIDQIIFFGTPHGGANKANFTDLLRFAIWPTPLTNALALNAASLRKANESYRILASQRKSGLQHKVLFETRSTFLGKIVAEGPADPGLDGVEPLGIDGDHFKIVKPADGTNLAYRIARDFVREGLADQKNGAHLVVQMPIYRPERSIDYLGLTIRLAVLIVAAAIGWRLYVGLSNPEGRESTEDIIRSFESANGHSASVEPVVDALARISDFWRQDEQQDYLHSYRCKKFTRDDFFKKSAAYVEENKDTLGKDIDLVTRYFDSIATCVLNNKCNKKEICDYFYLPTKDFREQYQDYFAKLHSLEGRDPIENVRKFNFSCEPRAEPPLNYELDCSRNSVEQGAL